MTDRHELKREGLLEPANSIPLYDIEEPVPNLQPPPDLLVMPLPVWGTRPDAPTRMMAGRFGGPRLPQDSQEPQPLMEQP